MKSISFDNPYWLLLAIPLLAVAIVPYVISVCKDNKTKGWTASLIIHITIAVFLTLAAAGFTHTTVMTMTKVYVVADVSYSSNRNLDEIDEYIQQIEDRMPQNSRLGVVCFGKNSTILTSSGERIKSVKEANVDDSGTDIAAALDFTSTLFSYGDKKRIILITDGFSTTADGSTAAAVERLNAKGIMLDTVYLDNNLRDGDTEAQISDLSYTPSTYVGHESSLKMLVESSVKNDVILDLYLKAEGGEYEKLDTTVLSAEPGMNIATLILPTDTPGVFDYRVDMRAVYDTSDKNNSYSFTQTVSGERNLLLLTEKYTDVTAIKRMYPNANVDEYVISGANRKVPYTVEEIVKYDQIILSNVDISAIENPYAFINAVDIAVSKYGKSLITLGNLYMNGIDTDDPDYDVIVRLEELLPVSFGNANKDSGLYTIILDVSRSMFDTSQLEIAKKAAKKLVSILGEDDYVVYITLSGSSVIEQPMVRLGDMIGGRPVRELLYEKIDSAKPIQGTLIGESLKQAYNHVSTQGVDFEDKQVVLISDGLSFSFESEDATEIAKKMYNDGITLSTVNVVREEDEGYLSALAEVGGGSYYFIEREEMISSLVFSEIADSVTDDVVETESDVNIKLYRDDSVKGILSLPAVFGYYNSKPKLDATMVLSVDYRKNSTTTVEVPLYSYRDHGNGRIASFTSDLSGNWLNAWGSENKNKFFSNLLSSTTPTEKIDYPFTVNVDSHGGEAEIEILPSEVNPKAKATIIITGPDGSVTEAAMVFDLNRYFAVIDTPTEGKYQIEIYYSYGKHTFPAKTHFTVNYSDEYNAFAPYDIGEIYDFMRGVGAVYMDGNVDLENDMREMDTYELSLALPLLIASAALFVADVIVRKFRWNDIKGIFAKKVKKGVDNN